MRTVIVVPAAVAPYLREGLLQEMGAAAERLAQITLSGSVGDEGAYDSALWRIEAARALLSRIGVDAVRSAPLRLDTDMYPLVLYKVLEAQHQRALTRSQDRQAEGLARDGVSAAPLAELERLLGTLRELVRQSSASSQEAHLRDPASGERITAVLSNRRRRRP